MDLADHRRLDALYRDPYPLYARARAADGLTFVPELDAWLVARDADVREVLRRPEDFSSANALRPDVRPCPAALAEFAKGLGGFRTVLSTDGEAHRTYRAPLNHGLSVARLNAVLSYATARAEVLVDAFAPRGQVELMGEYAEKLPGDVIGRVLGLTEEDARTAVHGSRRAEELLFRPLAEDEQVAAARDVVTLQILLDNYIRERRAHPQDDLISTMTAALVPGTGDLTRDQRAEMVSQFQNLLIAGHLTTTALIGSTVHHLLRDRAQWELLCAEPQRIPAAVEEAARFDTPIQGFRRLTTRTVTLAGTELPAGTAVFVAYGSANRDPARHPDPDAFDVTRTAPAKHLGFGHGVHGCPGSHLGKAQLRLTLELFTRRLPEMRLGRAADQQVVVRPTLIHRSPQALHLTFPAEKPEEA
ncbi:cytochrome P450 [Streptomyces spiroverticillatus]|uniref:Cytochrome P450 n=1 Tax=Streptomyces finlayi TaxID=67296 RepID=A0A919CAV4_9ACTN|nr:cytochrome P450 [Streptomyces finlayi]GHA15722.1 cytochrome P450 [Streptomyces spiroverticillatus]GHC96557.1 cytochrome P450 [Streptomyces finlayi]